MHTPLKKKLRANHSQCVTKALRKTIMRDLSLKKCISRNKTNESLTAYKNKKIIAASFIKKKRKLSDNLHTSVASNNQTFWKVIKLFLTNKSTFGRNIK